MKVLLKISLLPFLVISCGEHSINSEIYGSWQSVIDPKFSSSVSDSLIFQKPDSLKIYYIQNAKVVESMFGTFHLNKDKSKLITELDTSKFQFDVIELTNTSLQTRQIGKKAVLKYRRVPN